jgi:hypothetical protein
MNMSGGWRNAFLLAICIALPECLHAQGQPGPAGYAAPGVMPVAWPNATQQGVVPGNSTPSYGGYGPNFAGPHPNADPIAKNPYQTATVATAEKGVGYFGQDRIVTTWMDYDEEEELEETPLERALRNAFEDSSIRLEYMFMQIERPGYTRFGDQVFGVTEPANSFTVPGGTARVMNAGDLELTDNSGIQGTITTPLIFGTFELSAFLLEQSSDTISANEIIGGGSKFVAIPVKVNRGQAQTIPLFDADFDARFTSDIWNATANVISDPLFPGQGFKFRPMLGARFLHIQEHLTIDTASTLLGGYNSHISSDGDNNIYGVNTGFALELEHRWFTIGFRPEFMFGINNFRSRVETETLISPTDPMKSDEIHDTDFARVSELTIYGEFHLHENFSLFLSYLNLWAYQVQRPDNIIQYDTVGVNGIPQSSNFRVKKSPEDVHLTGFTVGGVLTWR